MSYDIDTNQILAELNETPAAEPPAEADHQTAQAPVPEPAPEPKFYEFSWNGQQVRGDENQLLKWASQGYDYSQKMGEINNRSKSLEEKYSKYLEIDDFATKNPDWWNHVENSWGSRETYNLAPEFQQALEPYVKELSAVKSFINDYQRQQEEIKAKEDDARLTNHIQEVQSKYTDVDFQSKDESGQTLEYRILKHANENGIGNFQTAFLDYYQDNLQKLYESRGRQAVEAERKKAREQGLLGKFPAPSSQQSKAPVQHRTYDDAFKAALSELGINQ